MAYVDAKPRQNPAKIHLYGDFDYWNGKINAYCFIWKARKVIHHVFLGADSYSGAFRTQFWLYVAKIVFFIVFRHIFDEWNALNDEVSTHGLR